MDFSGGIVDKNPPANAGDMGSIPGPRRFHRPWSNQSPCATTTEACVPSTYAPQQEKPLKRKTHALHLENSPCLPQLEKAHIAMKTQYNQKKL